MRYFIIPSTETILRDPKGRPEPMSFSEFLVEFVWGNPSWRDNIDSVQAWSHLVELFAKSEKPGDIIALTDKDHERLLPLVTMKGLQVAPGLTNLLNRYSMAFMLAGSKEPPPKAKTTSQAKPVEDNSSREASGISTET